MIYKILRKSGLGGTALKLAKPFIKGDSALPCVDEALEILTALSPDPAGSCLWDKPHSSGDFDLDILIPAYNVEKYLVRCLDSALSQQTNYSFRLIVIDDGSTDSSPAILDSYAQDPRVLVRHQKNMGLAGARNSSLALSAAKYIMFLDSDDTLPQGAIEALMCRALKEDACIIEGSFDRCDTEGRTLSHDSHKSGLLNPRKDLYGFACMKLFKAQVFERICFPIGYLYEDSIMAQIVYPYVQKCGYSCFGIENTVYNYTVNPSGITASSQKRPKSIDSYWISRQLYRDRQKLGLENDQDYYEYILYMVALSYRRTQQQSAQVKKAMFVLWRDFIINEFSGFDTENKNQKILQQALRQGNFALCAAACKLI